MGDFFDFRDHATTRFEMQDVIRLHTPGLYDLITAYHAIHDQARPIQVLGAIEKALRPHGIFLMVDFAALFQILLSSSS